MSLQQKLLVVGIDGLDPHLLKKYMEDGIMPNTKKFLEMGAANKEFEMIGGQQTVTPPMWTTIATGATPRVHGITGYYRHDPEDKTILRYNFSSEGCHAEQMWNVTAESGLKTLVWHWPGSSWPPSSDSPNLYVVDGTQPAGINVGTGQIDPEFLVAGDAKVQEVSFREKAAADAKVPCFITGMEVEDQEDSSKDLNMMVNRLTAKESRRITTTFEENVQNLSTTPMDMVSTTIRPATGWEKAPEDAKETTILYSKGLIRRPALILKNADGIYDHLAIYKNKKAQEPIVTLPLDVFVQDVVDDAIKNDRAIPTNRNMRLLEMAPDGNHFRLWISASMNFNDDTVWSPKSMHDLIIDKVGYPQPISLAGGSDEDLVSKCMRVGWDKSAEWNSKCIHYMAHNEGFQVIFSHFHNVDMQGHMLISHLKNGSALSPETCRRLWADVYIQTDNYIGSFLDMVEEGWDVVIVSDHGQTTPEYKPDTYRLNTGGVCAVDMEKLGYTVLKRDRNGNKIPEIDWTKTTAHTASYCHIFLNLKGRDPHGIVDPADKWDLEEKIITDLYNLRSTETGRRIVSVALHNKDAILFGEGGPDSSDIIYYIAEGYTADHSDGFSTTDGACNTSMRSVFMAAGPGIKKNYLTDRIVHHMDVAPTVATLLGTRVPAQCEGAPVYQIFDK